MFNNRFEILLDSKSMLYADFSAATVLVSFCVLIGKVLLLFTYNFNIYKMTLLTSDYLRIVPVQKKHFYKNFINQNFACKIVFTKRSLYVI